VKDLREVYPDICILREPCGRHPAGTWFWLAREAGDVVEIGSLSGGVIDRFPRGSCNLTSGKIDHHACRRMAEAEGRRAAAAHAVRKTTTARGVWDAFLDGVEGKH
jgi:hypothetical protein